METKPLLNRLLTDSPVIMKKLQHFKFLFFVFFLRKLASSEQKIIRFLQNTELFLQLFTVYVLLGILIIYLQMNKNTKGKLI